MFEGAEYNHYFFDSQLIWAILVLYERTFLNNVIKLQHISNDFFFAKLGSKYHNILIFFLIWGSSTIRLVHHTHTQSFHVTPIVVFNSRLN
jgi:hypothetical protein